MLRAMTLFSGLCGFFLGAAVRQYGYSVGISAGREGRPFASHADCLFRAGRAPRLSLIEAHDNRTAALIVPFRSRQPSQRHPSAGATWVKMASSTCVL